jgi:pteridine reductase
VVVLRNSAKREILQEAQTLADELNQLRANSATLIQAELSDLQALKTLANTIKQLDVLVNNASVFYPTSMQNANENDWNTIINTNLMAPFFLSQSLSATLSKNKGCIINIVDIHAQRLGYLVCSKVFYLASCLFVRR